MAENGKREAAALLLTSGKNVRDTAAQLAIGERTLHRWREDPAFRKRETALRGELLAAGFGMERVENVMGKADRDPLLPKDPAAASNRRISIIFLKQSLVAGARRAEDKFKKQEKEKEKGLGFNKAPPEPRKKEEGVIYFP